MPYFKSDEINLLLLHIPKTGGTSLEKYFSAKYNIQLNPRSLYGNIHWKLKQRLHLSASTFQHLIYKTILKYSNIFRLKNDPTLFIIAVVRNPYHRLVSDLFYHNLISNNSSQTDVYFIILQYFRNSYRYDNHTLQQYKFLLDSNNKLPEGIQILHTETLNDDMINLGFTDFNLVLNKNKSTLNYMSFLNAKSIAIINRKYRLDFQMFGYKML
jgi:hypothetical protein